MPADDSNNPAEKPEDVIARAKRELAERMLARMQEDDEQDERDGIEPSDSSSPSPASEFDSVEDWDLSGRSKSGTGHTSIDSLAASISSLGGGTLAEGGDRPKSTLELSDDALRQVDGGETASLQNQQRTPRFRPQRRAPMAVLVAWDDGGESGERFRLRGPTFDVGRAEGDLVIAHDQQMSRRHFRIERLNRAPEHADPNWEWRLRDLGSLNGVFQQQRSAIIGDGDEMLFGSEVVRIKQPRGAGTIVLTKVAVGDAVEQVTLSAGTHVFGSDASACVPFLNATPLLAPQHLKLTCDAANRWTMTALPGTDGVWTRTPELPLFDGVEWQAGEQRFTFLAC